VVKPNANPDPDCNPPESLSNEFAHTEMIVARIPET